MINIKDRLPDLKENLYNQNNAEHNETTIEELDNELAYKPLSGPMKYLLKMYFNIHLQLQDIENYLIEMKSMTSAEHINDFKQEEFSRLRCESIKIANNILKKFKKLENNLPQPDDFSTLARMKRGLYYGFFQQYIMLWSRNEQFLMDFEQKMKKKLQIQSQILNCNLSDDDIENLIENKNTNLFMSNILQNIETERRNLQEIQERFEDLKKLEKSIAEVHNLFITLQTLVAEQGDTIQRIEHHFDATHNCLETATVELKLAIKMKKHFRCCCC
ncbi:syntaxin-4-like isoform 2-T2 [Cochliomyia hominivorax]